MKINGPSKKVFFWGNSMYFGRVEGFQDDRFRLMFVIADGKGRDLKAIPVAFRKGTKGVDLDVIWPDVVQSFMKSSLVDRGGVL